MPSHEETTSTTTEPYGAASVASFLFGLLPYALLALVVRFNNGAAWTACVWISPIAIVLSLALGFVALRRMRKANARPAVRRLARAGLIPTYIAAALAGVAALLIASIHEKERSMPLRPACQNNLKQIGLCIFMYREGHGGNYPARFSDLYPEFVSDPAIFVCPASREKPGDPQHIDAWTTYAYSRPAFGTEDSTTPVAQEKASYHKPEGWNVLYADGHVEFVSKSASEASPP